MGARRAVTVISGILPVPLVALMVSIVPPSATALPDIEVATRSGAVRLTAEELGARVADGDISVDAEKVEATLDRLAKRVRLAASPGSFEMQGDDVVYAGGTYGLELDRKATRQVLMRALRGSDSELTLPMKKAPPTDFAIVARLSDFRLHLYEGAELRKSYLIGVGSLAYHGHHGAYAIASKSANPTWWNPGATWSRNMPRYVAPGPNNPLGSRALRLDRDLLAIHGTPDESSVGTNASRGCMRMYATDVQELFEIVPVGTPVFIYA